MPLLPTIGRTVGTAVRATRLLLRGSVRGGAWATRRVGTARAKGAANEIGMIRLFDLHALSCAGDTLIAIGLAGTIFFNVPLGEARSKVALYLLITMVPFALLAPVVGPLLDHFRHGRRYALAVTMLGRAFLAYVISDNLLGWGLYPAAFGVLALSRAYGVARSAAVPRLLPAGIGLSQVGARASVYGTFAGAVVAPIGLLAFKFGPQWSLRVATIIFVIGMVVALRLPPRADSDPPEAVPQPFRAMLRLGRGPDRPLSGRLVVSTLIGSASLRLLYGFLLLFLTFVIVGRQLDPTVFGRDIGQKGAVGLVGGALAVGTFLSTAVGTRLRIRRPLALQSAGLTVTAGMGVLAALFYNLSMVALLALVTAIFSGISKLAIDASIQERVPERLRASAFAHSETVLMIAWVVGGAIGIIPLPGRVGVALAALLAVAAAVRAGFVAARLHNERLSGRADEPAPTDQDPADADPVAADPVAADRVTGVTPRFDAADPWPDAPTVPMGNPPATPGPRTPQAPRPPGERTGTTRPRATDGERTTGRLPADRTRADRTRTDQTRADRTQSDRTRSGRTQAERMQADRTQADRTQPDRTLVDQTAGEPSAGRKWRLGRRKEKPPVAPPRTPPPPAAEARPPVPDQVLAPPGFHVYRPSSAAGPAPGGSPADETDAS
ncbi:MFS transporter [Micromonosporaceae bacterium Da 78-11]